VTHGFVADRSIVSNAFAHTRKRHVLNVDLEDFFPSINFGRVRGLFKKIGVPITAATILAQICCHEGGLPQGAPTSPILSNMVCARLDSKLMQLARTFHCTYTRYVDDITFSRQNGAFPPEIGRTDESGNAIVGAELRAIIESNGFRINSDKVWLFKNKHRQTVTGLTVNAKVNVPHRFVRQVRAMIHAWAKYGLEAAGIEHATRFYRRKGKKGEIPPFDCIIRGKLEFIKMVKGIRDPVYRKLQTQFVAVCPEYMAVMEKGNAAMDSRDVFLSHASEDKAAVGRRANQGGNFRMVRRIRNYNRRRYSG
jgi:RNA-directed DNA polymerase